MNQEGFAVFNPDGKPVEELPVIYGFSNGGSPGWMHAQLLSESGHGMGSHLCSGEWYMPHDLGCVEGSRADRHEGFKLVYPGGYRMEFVSSDNIKTHAGLQAAFAKAEEIMKASEAA